MAAIFNPADVVWGLGYLFGTQTNTDDVPFGTLQDFSLKDSLGLKELAGPEALTAVAVGASERKLTGEAQWGRIRLRQFLRVRGGVLNKQTGIANPNAAPTLTAAAGTTAFGAGWLAAAYSYVNAYGETLISPVQTVQVTSGQQVNVTAITPLPSGVTSANWYLSTQVYATSGAALAGPLALLINNTGGAFSMTAFPTLTTAPPVASNIGNTYTVYTASALDEPTPFKLHLKNPSDGSQAECYVYGCVCPELDLDIKTRDFVLPKMTLSIYGDNSTTPAKLYEIKLPGDQTTN